MDMNDIKNRYVLVDRREKGNNAKIEEISTEIVELLLEKGIAELKSGELHGIEQTNYLWLE